VTANITRNQDDHRLYYSYRNQAVPAHTEATGLSNEALIVQWYVALAGLAHGGVGHSVQRSPKEQYTHRLIFHVRYRPSVSLYISRLFRTSRRVLPFVVRCCVWLALTALAESGQRESGSLVKMTVEDVACRSKMALTVLVRCRSSEEGESRRELLDALGRRGVAEAM
jgi:hypothetical protein